MSIAARVKRLERARGTGGPCAGRFAGIVRDDEPIPSGASRCPRCGVPHLLRVRMKIVQAPGAGGGAP
jgi:hypothetical protein